MSVKNNLVVQKLFVLLQSNYQQTKNEKLCTSTNQNLLLIVGIPF